MLSVKTPPCFGLSLPLCTQMSCCFRLEDGWNERVFAWDFIFVASSPSFSQAFVLVWRPLCTEESWLQVIRHYHGHLSGVYALALHPQLDVLMTGGRDSVCRVWDMRTKVCFCKWTLYTTC